MFQDNELFNAILAVAVLVFIFMQLQALKRLPKGPILLSAYGILSLGLLVTVLEGVFWPSVLNIVEHACYMFSGFLFALWCWVALQSKNRKSI